MQVSVETTQLQAGIEKSVINTNIDWTKWVDKSWIVALWTGLRTINGGLETNFWTQRKSRKYDKHLMNIFLSWHIQKKELQLLNMCRLYLQVLTLSDIVTYNGKKGQNEYMECTHTRRSMLKWPRQPMPPPKVINSWKRAMIRLCDEENNLTNPLGCWIAPTYQVWRYMRMIPVCVILA